MKKLSVIFILTGFLLMSCGGSGSSGSNSNVSASLVDLSSVLNELVMIQDMVAMPDGSLLVAGFYVSFQSPADPSIYEYSCIVFKLLPSGELDTSFGTNGRTTFQVEKTPRPFNLSISNDESIYISGPTGQHTNPNLKLFVTRLTSSGAVDSSFGSNGFSTYQFTGTDETRAIAMGFQSDGKIVIGCHLRYFSDSMFGIVRFDTHGTLDTTFAVNGEYKSTAITGYPYHNLVIKEDDGIESGFLYGPPVSYLNGFTSSGAVDSNFGTNGVLDLTDDLAFKEIFIDSSDRTIIAGYNLASASQTDPEVTLQRFSSGSTLDASFGVAGKSYIDVDNSLLGEVFSLGEDSTGNIVVAIYKEEVPDLFGYTYSGGLQIARLDSTGAMDTTFDNDGIWVYDTSDYLAPITMAVASDKTIYIGGTKGVSQIYEEPFLLKVTVE